MTANCSFTCIETPDRLITPPVHHLHLPGVLGHTRGVTQPEPVPQFEVLYETARKDQRSWGAQAKRRRITAADSFEQELLPLRLLDSSLRSKKRLGRLRQALADIAGADKGFVERTNLLRYAASKDLPEEDVGPFVTAVKDGRQHQSQTRSGRFEWCFGARETGLRRVFDELDADEDDQFSSTGIAAGLASLCVNCTASSCSCRCAPKGSSWSHLTAGAVAGATSRTVTAPLETVRLQAMTGASGEATPIKAAKKIFSKDGWRGLYRGNGLNVLLAAPQKALDFFAFDIYKRLLGAESKGGLPATFVAAGLAGMTSTVILHPLEVLRSRLTCDVGSQYAGVMSTLQHVVKQEGLPGFYKGLRPSLLAILPEAMITYGMFDGLKRGYAKLNGREDAGILPSIAFGVASAAVGQMVSFPLESIARRLQVQKQAAQSIGMIALLQEIIRREGPFALYRGSGAALLRVLPMALTSFATYEVYDHEAFEYAFEEFEYVKL